MSASKRTSAESTDTEGVTPNKRKRHSVDPDNSDDEIGSCNLEEESRSGYIEKVLMVNFMCHNKLQVVLNRRINFIVGRNGSGKSAILSAVVIALGGNASCTNRASSLKDFIKSGANSANVEVTLTNMGLFAYKPEIYGPRIIVSRRIYSGTTPSAYKIMSSKGEVISTKREELKKIITTLNIQVDNPISVLNQDTARTFLASSDTKSKYSLFMKATRLEDVDQLHSMTLVYEHNAEHRLQMRKESLKQQEKEIKDLEKKANALNKLREIQKRTVDLENEYFWAMARDEEKALREIESKIEKEKEKSIPLKNGLNQYKEDLETVCSNLSNTQTLCDEMNQKVRDAENQINAAKKEAQKRYSEYKMSMKEYLALTKENDQLKQDITSILEEMAKFNSGDSAAIGQERERMRNEQLILKEQLEQIIATLQTTELEYSNLIGEFEHYTEQIRNLQKEKMNVKSSLASKRQQLDRLKSKADNLAIFGEWMPRLVKRIDDYAKQGRFVRKPLGPLGAFLKVKDASWARAIEMEMGFVLRSFACHCAKDAQILRQLFKEVNTSGRNPGILVSKFTDQLHNIRASCARAPGYCNIYDMLVIQDVNAANCFIDNCGIEGILLIPTGQEAAKLMSSRNGPPNCKKGITFNADQYFPFPDYRMYAGNPRARASVLQTSMEDAIRNLEGEIQGEEKTLENLEADLKNLDSVLRNNGVQKRNVDERKRALRIESSRINKKITDLQNAIDDLPDSQNMVTLTTEKATLEEKAAVFMEKSKKAFAISDEKKEVHKLAVKDLEEKQKLADEQYKRRQQIQGELGNIKEKVLKKENELKDFEDAYNAHCNKLNKLNDLHKRQHEKAEKAIHDAAEVCPERITTKRDVQDIKNELTDCKSYENVVGKENGITPEIIDVLHDKLLKFQDNVRRMKTLEHGLKILSASLESRKALYVLIRRVMSLKVSYVFTILLDQRGYKGKMNFIHDARTLEVQVSPRQEQGNRETKSLSGGERSYSTVSFILSLWECVEPPFYFMDEFDVFMDKLNRRVVINLLLIQARQSKKHQFVFLTPQDISSVKAADDITIHKLDDPERNKGAGK